MKKWYKVVSTQCDNYYSEYNYQIKIVIDYINHSRDWNYYKTKKKAEEAIQELLYHHLCD